MDLTIREAQPDDAEQLIAHVQALAGEPGINIVLAPGEFKLGVEEERQLLAEYAAADNAVFLVAEAGGRIIGNLNCKGGTRQATRHAVVLGIAVAKGWRGQGVGSALMARAIAWAKNSQKVSRIELYVVAGNQMAIHLYEKFGFAVEGRRRRAIYRDGEYLDDLIMALLV